MPGTYCKHYLKGRCLRTERLNPGLHKEWHCRVLMEWEEAYDQFLSQADAFQLDITMAARIWANRLDDMLRGQQPCADYCPVQEQLHDDSDVLSCAHSWTGLCLLSMPRCEGICEWFERQD